MRGFRNRGNAVTSITLASVASQGSLQLQIYSCGTYQQLGTSTAPWFYRYELVPTRSSSYRRQVLSIVQLYELRTRILLYSTQWLPYWRFGKIWRFGCTDQDSCYTCMAFVFVFFEEFGIILYVDLLCCRKNKRLRRAAANVSCTIKDLHVK